MDIYLIFLNLFLRLSNFQTLSQKCHSKWCILVILLFFAINIFTYLLISSPTNSLLDVTQIRKSQVETGEKIGPKETEQAVKRQQANYFFAKYHKQTASKIASKKILTTRDQIVKNYNQTFEKYQSRVSEIINALRVTSIGKIELTEKWASDTEVIPEFAPELGSILTSLCSRKIIKADNSRKGTQLKLLVTLEGGYHALFKPQWYDRNTVIHGPVYAGKDRHNAEVAAFHLSLLLGMRRVPLTVGRRVDLRREVMTVATPALKNTFFQEGNNTCFYGVCHYCSPADPVCAKRDVIEGALILWLPSKLKFQRFTHPWQRTYKNHLIARWEVDSSYCFRVQKMVAYSLATSERLLDLVDTSIFDFLIDNGDRHHYEALLNSKKDSVFLFDNGKSFGDPDADHIDILAPLYQCCILRKRTWENLYQFRGGVLGRSLEATLKFSHISPVLTSKHLEALDRRLLIIFAAVEVCMKENPGRVVLKQDVLG